MDIRVGDIITLKKQHPCGSKDWEVLRIGADFRLKCKGCDHQIMIPRPQAEKNIRNIQRKEEPIKSEQGGSNYMKNNIEKVFRKVQLKSKENPCKTRGFMVSFQLVIY